MVYSTPEQGNHRSNRSNKLAWFTLLLISVGVTGLIVNLAFAQESTDSQPDGLAIQTQQGVLTPGNDSLPAGAPEVLIPDKYQPARTNAPSPATTATAYFTPQDENTSTTVMFLYNTSNLTATVGIETFNLTGSPYINTTVAVPPGNLVRICADAVSTISTSWQDVVLINFTTNSTYAKMTLPAGVKADGYVVWNGGGTYDPLQVAPTLPLRFSVDPPTLFLPTATNN